MLQPSKKWFVWGTVVATGLLLVLYLNRPQPLVVQTALATVATVEQTVANTRVGSVIACNRSRLSPAIGGQVAKLYVDEGQRVESGELLLELWNKDRKAQLQQAQAGFNFREIDRQRICISADADEREAIRSQQLLKKNLTSQENADQLQSRAAASRAGCSSAQAMVDEARARVALAEAAVEQTYLRAPFGGIVAEVTGEVGEFTTPSPPGVATPPAIDLLTNDCHYVIAPIDEVDAADIKVGMPVRVTLDAFRDTVFSGTVARVSAYVLDVAKQARTVDVEVSFDPEVLNSNELIAGYSADIEVVLASEANVLSIPSEAVRDDNSVYVLADGVIVRKSVTTGLSNWRTTEVLNGLTENDEVILSLGRDDIVPGASATASDQ